MKLRWDLGRMNVLDHIRIGDQFCETLWSDVNIDERVDHCWPEGRHQMGEALIFDTALPRLFGGKVCCELRFQRFANRWKINAGIERRSIAGAKRDRKTPE